MASRLTRGPTSPCQRSISSATTASWRSSRSRPAARSPMRKPMPRAWTPSERQPHLQVAPLPHPDRGLELDPGHHQAHRRVAAPEGGEGLDRLGRAASPRSRPPTTASTRAHPGAGDRRAARPRRRASGRRGTRATDDAGQLQAHRPGVPAPAGEGAVRGRPRSRGGRPPAGCGPSPSPGRPGGRSRSPAARSAPTSRTATMPTTPSCQPSPAATMIPALRISSGSASTCGDGLVDDLPLHLAALLVERARARPRSGRRPRRRRPGAARGRGRGARAARRR